MSRNDTVNCMDMAAVALNLKKARESLGLSQEDAAERAKMAVRTLSRLETGEGNPTLSTLMALADVYGITLDALTGRPSFARARVAEQVAVTARFEKNWGDAADLLGAVARSKPVRRLAGLYILTRDKRYLEALRAMLPPQSPLFQWLDQAP